MFCCDLLVVTREVIRMSVGDKRNSKFQISVDTDSSINFGTSPKN